ncbi:MAG: DUF3566 domain-containing protein [bacterium]
MRYEIKAIGFWPFIKISFFFNLIIGFLFGLLYALMLSVIMTIAGQLSNFPIEGLGVDIEELSIGGMVVIMPILFAILGAVFHTLIGVVLIAIYNLIARLVGGLEFDLKAVTAEPHPTPAPPPTGVVIGAPVVPPTQPSGPPPTTPAPPMPPPSAPSPPPPGQSDPGTDSHREGPANTQ